jgi:hypothetical protein
MARASGSLAFALAITLAVAVAPAAETTSFRWPVPEGWRAETIPFPLDFAKALPLKGVEELRFAPGMFKPDEPGYWSYAFVWWLDGRPAMEAKDVESALTQYFAGLITAVGQEKGFAIDPAHFRVSIHAVDTPAAKLGHAVHAFTGTVDSYDGFATGKPIVLTVDVRVWDCVPSGKRAVMVLASPARRSASIWTSLHAREEEFKCHEPR